MALRVAWAQRAVRDLEVITAYIAADSPAYASTVVRNIVSRTRTLADFPKSGRKVPEFDDDNIREPIVYSYRVIYQVEGEEVVVAAVMHGKRDLR